MRIFESNFGRIDCAFAGQPDALAAALTTWLWADKVSNPDLWDQPDKWDGSGFGVQFVDRTLNFTGLANGATATDSLNLGGGRNILVFSRVCSVTPTSNATDPNTIVLPNQLSSFASVAQQRQDGLDIIEAQPIILSFGWGLAPYIFPVPEFWTGNIEQKFTVINNVGYAIDIAFSWHIAFLHTGR